MTVIFGDYLSVNNLNSRNEGSGVLFHFSLFIYGSDMDVFGLHQLFKQPTFKVVNKTEFHAHSYAECRGGGGGDTQHKTG